MPGKGFKQGLAIRNRKRNKRGGQPRPSDGLKQIDKECLASLYPCYIDYLRVRNYSDDYRDTQRFNLVHFIRWSQQRDLYHPKEMSRPILESYQRHVSNLKGKTGVSLSVRTQREKICTLKGFFKWLCRQYLIEKNPAIELEYPRSEKRLPQIPMSEQEVDAVLREPDTSDPLGIRDRAILELFYSTGIRRCEMVSLQTEHFEAHRKLLVVRQGKGRKDRYVPVGTRAVEWVQRYLDQVRPLLEFTPDESTLFLSSYGEAINADVLSRKVSRYIESSGIGRGGSCHLFRHTCATHMLENGADIRFIQKLLGHESLKSTQIYTEVNIKKLQEVYSQTHPGK